MLELPFSDRVVPETRIYSCFVQKIFQYRHLRKNGSQSIQQGNALLCLEL